MASGLNSVERTRFTRIYGTDPVSLCRNPVSNDARHMSPIRRPTVSEPRSAVGHLCNAAPSWRSCSNSVRWVNQRARHLGRLASAARACNAQPQAGAEHLPACAVPSVPARAKQQLAFDHVHAHTTSGCRWIRTQRHHRRACYGRIARLENRALCKNRKMVGSATHRSAHHRPPGRTSGGPMPRTSQLTMRLYL